MESFYYRFIGGTLTDKRRPVWDVTAFNSLANITVLLLGLQVDSPLGVINFPIKKGRQPVVNYDVIYDTRSTESSL